MKTNTVIYGPLDSPTMQRFVRYKKRFKFRYMIIDESVWKSGTENATKVVVSSDASPIAEAYRDKYAGELADVREQLSAMRAAASEQAKQENRKIDLKAITLPEPELELKVIKFAPKPSTTVALDLDTEIAGTEARDNRLNRKGFPLSKEGKERVHKMHAGRNPKRKV